MECRWQVEIDPFCQSVLEKHWPDVLRHGDIKDVESQTLEDVDVIAGGFPCPVVSQAARGRNTGEWLWPEFRRIVHELTPRFCVIENVDALRYRGLRGILGDLASMGYDAEWRAFPASWFGAPHRRTRLWLVAYSNSDSESDCPFNAETSILQGFDNLDRSWPDTPTNLRMDDGVPRRMALKAYGSAVVPVVAEWIGGRLI